MAVLVVVVSGKIEFNKLDMEVYMTASAAVLPSHTIQVSYSAETVGAISTTPSVGVGAHAMMSEHVEEHVVEVAHIVMHSDVVVVVQSDVDSDCEEGCPGPALDPGDPGTGGGLIPLHKRQGLQSMRQGPSHQILQVWPQLCLHVGLGFPDETVTVGLFLVAGPVSKGNGGG